MLLALPVHAEAPDARVAVQQRDRPEQNLATQLQGDPVDHGSGEWANVFAQEQGHILSLWRDGSVGDIQGNYITLSELFFFFRREASAFDLYRLWTDLDIFMTKRFHSMSQSDNAIMVRNVKGFRHSETGIWGLNRRN